MYLCICMYTDMPVRPQSCVCPVVCVHRNIPRCMYVNKHASIHVPCVHVPWSMLVCMCVHEQQSTDVYLWPTYGYMCMCVTKYASVHAYMYIQEC